MMSLSFIVVLMVAVLTVIGVGFRSRWLAISAPAVLFGGMSYFFVSMYAARLMGAGRFFSVPFGGYAIDDWHIPASVLLWTALWGSAFHLVMPRWGADKPGKQGRVDWKNVGLRVVLAVLPLGLTPVLGWLIAESYLNFGGGCKDIVMVFPWMAWSLFYFVVFVFMTVKKAPLGRTLAWSAGGATGALAVILLILFALSLSGIRI